jgi:hypothetical protein
MRTTIAIDDELFAAAKIGIDNALFCKLFFCAAHLWEEFNAHDRREPGAGGRVSVGRRLEANGSPICTKGSQRH